jgi:sterol desaturase/sphingolipid hydroxylase (fatty acid hydroxylase superfamily)
MIEYIFIFLSWTLCLYGIHRIIHKIPYLKDFHNDHHLYVNRHNIKWSCTNFFFFTDTWISTIDLWITEVIPTLIFSTLTGHWWIFWFYYIWAATLQENLEHNKNLNWYLLTSGKWHMIHHKRPNTNFGLFLPIWDKIFKTYQHV